MEVKTLHKKAIEQINSAKQDKATRILMKRLEQINTLEQTIKEQNKALKNLKAEYEKILKLDVESLLELDKPINIDNVPKGFSTLVVPKKNWC